MTCLYYLIKVIVSRDFLLQVFFHKSVFDYRIFVIFIFLEKFAGDVRLSAILRPLSVSMTPVTGHQICKSVADKVFNY
jgi:hypothetical protein